MDKANRPRGVVWLLALVACCSYGALAAEDYVGSETCEVCHEEVVQSFALTAHAIAPGWDAEKACESCHGPGAEHADGEVEAIIRPQGLSPREASENCLSCHSRQQRQFRSKHAVHTLADVSCIDCHNPHSTADQMLEVSGVDLCAQCHQNIVAQFDLARSHPLPDDGKACENCHEPHTSNTPRRTRGQGNPICTNCHFDKAGPYLYAHDVSLTDDCTACHQLHGSPNRHLLRHARMINLCYECHAATQTPTFHNAQNFLNEKCTACHTAIHGSNTHPAFLEE